MSEPKNPDTILFKNKYYSKGFNERMVWDYYMKNKRRILKYTDNNPLVMFLYTKNGYVVLRYKSGSKITLTKSNYEDVINGRSVSFAKVTDKNIDYICIDIDAGNKVSEKRKKSAVNYLINQSPIMGNIPDIKDYDVFLSSTSYHVYFNLSKSKKKKSLLKKTYKLLTKDKDNPFSVSRGARGNLDIAYDLTPMYDEGAHTTKWALNKNGLIYMDITNIWQTFDRGKAAIEGWQKLI